MSATSLDELLERRLDVATALARETLGEQSPRRHDLAALIEAVAARAPVSAQPTEEAQPTAQAQPPAEAPAAGDAGAGDAGAAEHAAALERLRHRYEARFDALREAQTAVAELRDLTAPATMLARAPRALCEHSTLRRAIVSVVREGKMLAEAAHFTGEERAARDALAALRERPVALEHPLIETELLRRRRATLVVDAHVHPRVDRRTATLLRWRSYVAAPLLVGSTVIGVIHADRGPQETVDVLEREVLWEFATGLTQAYESAGLRRALRHERDQMRQFLEWVGARSAELADARITLAAQPEPAQPRAPTEPTARTPDPSAPAPSPDGRDDSAVFAGLLTGRELDVLRLLAEGNSNKAIADALVVSSATVKFHMGGILRKLHVANRAEAVSRYLSLLGIRLG